MLVLLGSLGTTTAMWEPQLGLLQRFCVIRCDHPGHGRSPVQAYDGVPGIAAQVVDVLDELAVERASVCGVSLGGAVAMAVAVAAPERVEGLVLAATAARFPNAESFGERAEVVRRQGVESVADAVLARWFTPAFHRTSPAAVRRYREMIVSVPNDGYARGCEAVRDWDARGEVHGIEAATLVVAGADDPATPPEDAPELAAAIPDARLLVIPSAAHLLSVEQPRAFADALLEHLGG
jgi:3-oxoadipate enol-lactonase